eukprot:CAMPEP_0113452402 /NCGR_PEP_ID=MMETSP0014_2-20120614/6828_1 /TAXON_ID=2857 /ORGANISM="Nitzschia sp." /LENGTH=744 /DNA_ID=CAMNT_0000343773 /DNA_START=444 /DNA_END=2678 /DNA_ORIENTATION=+ /assembly_acc=CAM_ASM_000159
MSGVNSDTGGSSNGEQGRRVTSHHDIDDDGVNNNNNNNSSSGGSFTSSSFLMGQQQGQEEGQEPMEPEAEYQPARSSWLFPPSIVGRPPSPPPPVVEGQSNGGGGVEGEDLAHDHHHRHPTTANEQPPPPVRVINTSDWQRVVIVDDTTDPNAATATGATALDETHGSFQHVYRRDPAGTSPFATDAGGIAAAAASANGTGTGTGGSGHQGPESQLGRGVLILDGLSQAGSSHGGGGGDDPSTLSIPGSESLPSDPGTIHHSDEDDHTSDANWDLNHLGSNIRHCARNLFSSAVAATGTNSATPNTSNRRHARQARSSHHHHHRRHNDNNGSRHQGGLPTAMGRRGLWSTVAVAVLVIGGSGAGLYRHQKRVRDEQQAIQQALMEVQLQNERLKQEEEALRMELHVVQEEARAAAAAAMAVDMENDELLRLAGSRKKGGSAHDDGGFDWSNGEECDDGMSSFNVLDNCWVKAKAKVQMGDCGDGTLDYFKDLWNGMWDSIDSGLSAMTDHQWTLLYDEMMQEDYESKSNSDNKEQGSAHEQRYAYSDYQEEFVPQHVDPLVSVLEAIHSAGKTVGAKFSQLMNDEMARAADVEQAIQDGLVQASDAVKDTMDGVKREVQDLSREALTAFHTLVKKRQTKPIEDDSNLDIPDTGRASGQSSLKTDPREQDQDPGSGGKESSTIMLVTRQGLFDAASALSALTKTLQETVTSLSISTRASADKVGNDDTKTTSSSRLEFLMNHRRR